MLARRLGVRFGAERVTLSLLDQDPTRSFAQSLGVNILSASNVSDRKRPLATLAGLAQSARVLSEHVKRARADVVCIAMNFASAAPLALTLRRPVAYFAHDPVAHAGDYARGMQKFTQDFLLKRSKAVVALSRFGAEQLNGVSRARLHVAPLSSVFAPQAADRNQRASPVRLLMLGRMLDYKGLDVLADALPAIHAHQHWRLTIAGDGPALDAQMAARFADPRISVRRGWLSHAETQDLLRTHDVMLAPYREASQSGVVCEALAWGLPVIAAPVGALAEQIGNGRAGWLSEPQAFGMTLAEMLNDPATRMRKAEAARGLAQEFWEQECWEWLADLVV